MCKKERLKRINEALQPYYLFFMMILFFLTSLGTISRFFSNSRSDIIVSVRYDRMEYPSSINNKYISIYNSIIQTGLSDTIINDANDVRRYLTQTQSVKHITIKNNRKRLISNIAFRDCSVSVLTAYGNGSTFKLSNEGDNLLNKMSYDARSNIVYLEEPLTLYPKEEFYITLWGSFNSLNDNNSIFVNYDDRTAKVVTTKEFSGFPAIIADYYEVFLTFMLLIFFVVLYYSVERKKNG